jgi:hypothetical protein
MSPATNPKLTKATPHNLYSVQISTIVKCSDRGVGAGRGGRELLNLVGKTISLKARNRSLTGQKLWLEGHTNFNNTSISVNIIILHKKKYQTTA